jgi:hypothetical protein
MKEFFYAILVSPSAIRFLSSPRTMAARNLCIFVGVHSIRVTRLPFMRSLLRLLGLAGLRRVGCRIDGCRQAG